MDVMVYSLVLPTLLVEWHISKGQAGLLSTATLLFSSLGGWLAGILADRVGRVRMLKLTIFWFAFFTFLSGFTQNFQQLLIVRSLQGLGFGGEWAVGAALMGESIRARYRGRAVGTVQAGWAIGWGISVLLFTILFSRLPHELAWRVMFWIGILPALLIVYIRGKVEEPELFRNQKQTPKLLAIFSAPQLRTTLLASLMALGAQGGYHAVTTWLPFYLKTARGLSTLNTGGYLCVVIAGAFLGYLAAAYLSDAIGRKRTLILFAACSMLAVLCYARLPHFEPTHARAWFPIRFLLFWLIQSDGRLFFRTLPHLHARFGSRLCLQLGSRRRRYFSRASRLRKRPCRPRNRHLTLRLCSLSTHDPGRPLPTRNQRPAPRRLTQLRKVLKSEQAGFLEAV